MTSLELGAGKKMILWILKEFSIRTASFKSKETTTYVYYLFEKFLEIGTSSANSYLIHAAAVILLFLNPGFIKRDHLRTFPSLPAKTIEPTGYDVM